MVAALASAAPQSSLRPPRYPQLSFNFRVVSSKTAGTFIAPQAGVTGAAQRGATFKTASGTGGGQKTQFDGSVAANLHV